MNGTRDLERVAEAPLAWVAPEAGGLVDSTDERFVLQHSPLTPDAQFGAVLNVRLAGHRIDDALAYARQWFRALGRDRYSWWIRESANPAGTVAALEARGLRRHPVEPLGYAAMMIDRPPPRATGVKVRQAMTTAETLAAADVFAEAFALSEKDARALRESVRRRGMSSPDRRSASTFLAFIDAELAARGTVCFTDGGIGALFAGGTLPRFRGRGCHRALVRARWDATRARGGAGLVVHAGVQSRALFEDLGFSTLDVLTVLIDASGSRSA